ncbi:flap structure-specific endonuclease [Moniliophthora roreri MCA 2997]|uniref:Flap structure-specific endonuclease n=1 Tax=Moniliophthora roreri (strain MCA 2997) TaxID=1381753 RepID=V2WV18_MONRO|nr:flap structure-specific endonuclease [Moniliophthora roreri MCA 2997]
MPVFFFDGLLSPPFKHNIKIKTDTIQYYNDAKCMIISFGWEVHTAPGEAEAELAECNARGILDCVLSNNVDTLIFGAQHVACLTKPDSHKDDIIIYLAVAIENNNRLGLNHEGLILIASVSGRDYHKGIEHAGIQTGIALACAGYGSSLAAIYQQYTGEE